MKIRPNWLPLFALAGALTFAAAAQADFARVGNAGGIEFTAQGPLGLNIDGKAPLTVAQQEGSALVFKSDLRGAKTGIGLRDSHLLKALKSKEVKLKIERAKLKIPEGDKVSQGTAEGTLTFNGKEGKVNVNYKAKSQGGTIAAEGSFHFNYTDYGMEKQCFQNQCVDPKVAVTARVKLTDK